jgi:hypothetical protein
MNEMLQNVKMPVFISFQVDEDDVYLFTDIPSLVENFLKVGLKKHNAVSMGVQT